LANSDLSLQILDKLLQNEAILSKPRRISAHLAICIGKIMSKHLPEDLIKQTIQKFIDQKLAPNLSTHGFIYASHLKLIFKNLSQAHMGFLSTMTDFPIIFLTYEGSVETCIKLADVVLQVVTYLPTDTKV
jgi:hypothetical protein